MISQAKDHLDTMVNMDMPHSSGAGMAAPDGLADGRDVAIDPPGAVRVPGTRTAPADSSRQGICRPGRGQRR